MRKGSKGTVINIGCAKYTLMYNNYKGSIDYLKYILNSIKLEMTCFSRSHLKSLLNIKDYSHLKSLLIYKDVLLIISISFNIYQPVLHHVDIHFFLQSLAISRPKLLVYNR